MYLYNTLREMGRSDISAMYDVALVALDIYDSRLSDAAASIITSKPYLVMDKE